MSMFHVGQRVACISDWRDWPPAVDYARQGYVYPEKGLVYTIRQIGPWNMELVLLEEIINPIPSGYSYEPGFRYWNFKPVEDTSIESLRSLLSPIPEEVA